MKHLALIAVLSLAAVGCASAPPLTPQSVLDEMRTTVTRLSYGYAALDDGYMALCFQREDAEECKRLDAARAEALGGVNRAVQAFNKLREKIAALQDAVK